MISSWRAPAGRPFHQIPPRLPSWVRNARRSSSLARRLSRRRTAWFGVTSARAWNVVLERAHSVGFASALVSLAGPSTRGKCDVTSFHPQSTEGAYCVVHCACQAQTEVRQSNNNKKNKENSCRRYSAAERPILPSPIKPACGS